MKQLLFWTFFVPIALVNLGVDLIVSCIHYFCAAAEVYDVLVRRFEYWSFDQERGVDMNCPFRYTLKEVFDDAMGY